MFVLRVGRIRTWLLAVVVSSVRRARRRRRRKEETERNMAQIEGRKLPNASHWLFQPGLVSIAVCLHVLLLFETKSGATERLAGIPWRAQGEPNLATSVSGVRGVRRVWPLSKSKDGCCRLSERTTLKNVPSRRTLSLYWGGLALYHPLQPILCDCGSRAELVVPG
ncbi:hypothetical protein IWW34DRAFT_295487 [Fusarium oxysporum f. sp. albedinis]|nr:hypothetical protein IWW34DRAFT_295487 [Fusarium oxysporum f. sp. albedinis]